MQYVNINRTSFRLLGTVASAALLTLFSGSVVTAQSPASPGGPGTKVPVPVQRGKAIPKAILLSLAEKNALTRNNGPTYLPPIVVRRHPINTPVFLNAQNDFTSPGVPLAGHIPGIVAAATRLGPMDKMQELTVTFSLRPRNQAQMDDLVKRVYDPNDPLFHKFLKPAERIARFSPTQDDFNTVVAFAQQKGLRVTDSSVDRQLIMATGTVGQIEDALGVHLNHYKAADDTTFYAPDGEPTVPRSIAPLLYGIHNLTNAGRPHSNAIPRASLPRPSSPNVSGPGSGSQPNDIGIWSGPGLSAGEIKKCYNLAYSTNGIPLTGGGQHVALVEFGGFDQNDINYYIGYNQYVATPSVSLNTIPIQTHLLRGYGGGTNRDTGEVELDIEMLEAVADGLSQIDVYEEDADGDMIQEMNQILNDNTANQVSISYGSDETAFSAVYESSYVGVTEQMALQGQAIFVSSGDHGAYDNTPNLTVNVYAASPYVTGVGGTSLWIDQNIFGDYGAFSYEHPWNNIGGATGGGISQYIAIPNYQYTYLTTPGNQASFSSPISLANRNVPDVALDADPFTGYYTHVQGVDAEYGGTSASAPIWAAFWAHLNQLRALYGVPAIGFANPPLYAVANGGNYNSAFHDVYGGGNNYYDSVVGYDCTTGLGSINGLNMLNNLANDGAWSPTASLNLSQSSVMSGQQIQLNVTLDTPVPSGGSAIVTYASLSNGYAYYLTARYVYNGSTSSASVTAPDVVAWTNESYICYAIYYGPNGQALGGAHWTNAASLTVTPNTLKSVSFSPNSTYGGQTITATVTLNGPAAQDELVDLFSSDPTNAPIPTIVTIPAGADSVSVPIVTKSPAAAEQVTITALPDSASGIASGPVNGQFTVSPLLSTFNVSPNTVHSGASAMGNILFSQGAATDLTLQLKSSNPNIANVPASIFVPAGDNNISFTVATKACNLVNKITLTATVNGETKTVLLTVIPAQLTGVSVAPTAVSCTASATGTVTLDLPAGSNGRSVSLKSSNTAVVSLPASVKVPAGQTTATFPITTHACNLNNNVTITAKLDGVTQTTTLKVNASLLKSLTISPSRFQAGKTATGTVTLDVPAGSNGHVVTLSSDNPNVVSLPTSVKVAAGQTTATFNVTGRTAGAATIKGTFNGISRVFKITVTP